MPKKPVVIARALYERTRELIVRGGPGVSTASRSLFVRRDGEGLRNLWSDRAARAAVLDGIPVRAASADFGDEAGLWGRTATVRLDLATPMPRSAAQILAGKAVRRLKTLAETGEIPTTEGNPSFRTTRREASK
jgi:hypothetical protein